MPNLKIIRAFKNLAYIVAFACAVFVTSYAPLQAGIVTPIVATLTVHYKDGLNAGAANIAWIEIKDGILGPTSPFGLPDPFNYGFNFRTQFQSPSDFTNLQTEDSGINPVFEFGAHGGVNADWTIDYYAPDNGTPVDSGSRTRNHTVLFGSISNITFGFGPGDGPNPPGGTGTIQDVLYMSMMLTVDDGIYHSINNPELYNQPLGEATYGVGPNYNQIEFTMKFLERNLQSDTDGLNFWDGSGVLHVPEPGTFAIFGLGLVGLGLMRRRRRVAA